MKTIKTTMSFCDCWCPHCDYSISNCSADTECPYCEEILSYNFEPIKEKQLIECENCNKKYSVIVWLDYV